MIAFNFFLNKKFESLQTSKQSMKMKTTMIKRQRVVYRRRMLSLIRRCYWCHLSNDLISHINSVVGLKVCDIFNIDLNLFFNWLLNYNTTRKKVFGCMNWMVLMPNCVDCRRIIPIRFWYDRVAFFSRKFGKKKSHFFVIKKHCTKNTWLMIVGDTNAMNMYRALEVKK